MTFWVGFGFGMASGFLVTLIVAAVSEAIMRHIQGDRP